MQVPTVIVILGALLFLLGILGGGISLKEISLPPVSTRLRAVLIPLSIVMMAFGVWLSLGGTISLPSQDTPQPQAQTPQESGVLSASTPLAPAAQPAPSPTASVDAVSVPYYEQVGALIYEEDLEDGIANGWDGEMEIIQLADGNHVWRAENEQPRYILPGGVLDYAVEARIMQHEGPGGAAGVTVRVISGEACAYYFSYIDFAGGWLPLVENTALCEENRGPDGLLDGYQFPFSSDVWYTLALEATGSTIRVYLDGEPVGSDQDDTYQSNIVGLWSCCGDSGPHVFYFDDVRIWSLE